MTRVTFCNWCPEPNSPDPLAHPGGQRAHLTPDPMADRLCTPSDLACFMQDDADTYTAILCIEAATAVVQSLVGERIACGYPPGAQELELARAVTVTLARDACLAPKTSHALTGYERAYETAATVMDESPHLRAALKLQYDRRLAVLSAQQIADAIEAEAARMRDEDWPGKVGIGYINGFEDAARIAREHADAPETALGATQAPQDTPAGDAGYTEPAGTLSGARIGSPIGTNLILVECLRPGCQWTHTDRIAALEQRVRDLELAAEREQEHRMGDDI